MAVASLPNDLVYDALFPFLSDRDLCSWLMTSSQQYNMEESLGKKILHDRCPARIRPIRTDRSIRLFVRLTRCTKSCFFCLKTTSSVHPLYQTLVCPDCRKLEAHRAICKSDAIRRYHLNTDDLIHLPSVAVRNPYGSHHPDMTLFLERDVIQYTLQNQSVIDKRLELKAQKLNRKEELRLKRKNSLIRALEKKGLVLRNDSRLCEAYIQGKKRLQNMSLTLNFIVHQMCIMKYLYEYTPYQTLVEQEVKNIAEEYEYYPHGVYMMAQERIKAQIPIPGVFPWLHR